MERGEPYFCVKRLRKTWFVDRSIPGQGFTIDFSVECERGEMLALVGPSGCGKSTVLRMIAGLTEPDSVRVSAGSADRPAITLDGKDITCVPPWERDVGMVFQQPALFPHMRTDDNVAYGLRCRGVCRKEARRRADEILERMGLSGFGGRNPSSLSGGEAQRVSLARTLILSPKLVLFDEPLSALDAPLRRRLAADIVETQRRTGFTGVFVTHDIDEAKSVATRIVEMERGVIVRDCPSVEYER